jgi:RecA/RadA recombinase
MPRTKIGAKKPKRSAKGKPGEAAKRMKVGVAPVPPAAQYLETQASVSRFAALGKSFDQIGWGQASSVLREVRAVPTIFPWLDYVLRVGGWPTDRFGLIHGPSSEGKTVFVIGLMLSFLLADHAAAYIDAERTTPPRWLKRVMGRFAEHPGFRALYPTTYEQTVDSVRAWCNAIGDAKAHRKLDDDTTGIVVVDSLRKLVPKRLLDKLTKEGSSGPDEDDEEEQKKGRYKKKAGGVDGMAGRAAQYKAALNAAWMDELTPLLGQTGTCLVCIGREYEDNDVAGSFSKGPGFKLGGGGALFFESAVVARVTMAEVIRDDEKRTLAERHSIEIRKTKIEAKERRYPTAYFHSTAAGFDRARDLFMLGRQLELITQGGSWFAFEGEHLGQGEDAALRYLGLNVQTARRLEDRIRHKGIPEDALVLPEVQPDAGSMTLAGG